MSHAEIALQIAATMRLVTAGLDAVDGAASGPGADLAALFHTLMTSESPRARVEAEDEIWATWYRHPDPGLEQRMDEAIAAMAQREMETARSLLDALVADAPDWAEGWNKRATLHFVAGRVGDSIRDIQRTLALEPRHFGAIGGFAQICLRAGDPESALIALQVAVRLNPNLVEMRQMSAKLARQLPRTVH